MENSYQIWQIADIPNVPYAFRALSPDMEKHLKFGDYKKVYEGDLSLLIPNFESVVDLAEIIFAKHNADDRPAGQTSRSISVSDILLLDVEGERTVLYVEPVGYTDIKKQCPDVNKEFLEQCESAPRWNLATGEFIPEHAPDALGTGKEYRTSLDDRAAEVRTASLEQESTQVPPSRSYTKE